MTGGGVDGMVVMASPSVVFDGAKLASHEDQFREQANVRPVEYDEQHDGHGNVRARERERDTDPSNEL